jgi:hypothetical protein
MPYVRMPDYTLNQHIRRQVAQDILDLTVEFCRAASHPYTMRRLEDAFNYHLVSWATSALIDRERGADKQLKEVRRLIDRAREISAQYAA